MSGKCFEQDRARLHTFALHVRLPGSGISAAATEDAAEENSLFGILVVSCGTGRKRLVKLFITFR